MMDATMRNAATYAAGCWPQGYPAQGLHHSTQSRLQQGCMSLLLNACRKHTIVVEFDHVKVFSQPRPITRRHWQHATKDYE